MTSTNPTCRFLDCDWRFTASGRQLVGECRRGCGRRASHEFRDEQDAARLAGYLGRGGETTVERLLRPALQLLDRLAPRPGDGWRRGRPA
jgi:hypothetical protein